MTPTCYDGYIDDERTNDTMTTHAIRTAIHEVFPDAQLDDLALEAEGAWVTTPGGEFHVERRVSGENLFLFVAYQHGEMVEAQVWTLEQPVTLLDCLNRIFEITRAELMRTAAL